MQPAYRCGGKPMACATVTLDLCADPARAALQLRMSGLGGIRNPENLVVHAGGLPGRVLAVEGAGDLPGVDLVTISIDPVAIGAGDVPVWMESGGALSNRALINLGRLPRLVDPQGLSALVVDADGNLLYADAAEATVNRLIERRIVALVAGSIK